MIGRFFDIMILTSTDIDWVQIGPSKCKSWKVLETVSSHLKAGVKVNLSEILVSLKRG